jgi:hypothetical protein
MRHIILHHHIFKNAGSTLDSSLAAQFGTGFSHLEDEGNPVHANALVRLLDSHPGIQAVSSHNFQGLSFEPFLGDHGYRAFNFAMIRAPLQRLISMYKYFRGSEPSSDLALLARELDLRTFVERLIERYPHMVDSPQVNIVANDGFYGHAVSDSDLEKACARYATFSLCAPVERYDEAMVVLEYFNSPVYLPRGLDMAYVRQNVSNSLPGENELEALLGEHIYKWLGRLHARDEHLWGFANAELDRRISLVPDFHRRLAGFLERCKELENGDHRSHGRHSQ